MDYGKLSDSMPSLPSLPTYPSLMNLNSQLPIDPWLTPAMTMTAHLPSQSSALLTTTTTTTTSTENAAAAAVSVAAMAAAARITPTLSTDITSSVSQTRHTPPHPSFTSLTSSSDSTRNQTRTNLHSSAEAVSHSQASSVVAAAAAVSASACASASAAHFFPPPLFNQSMASRLQSLTGLLDPLSSLNPLNPLRVPASKMMAEASGGSERRTASMMAAKSAPFFYAPIHLDERSPHAGIDAGVVGVGVGVGFHDGILHEHTMP